METWTRKYKMGAVPSVLFANNVSRHNVIYTLDELRRAVRDKNKLYRIVPLPLLEQALVELQKRESLSLSFMAVAA